MLKASLAQTEIESARMDTERVNVDEKMQILEKSIMQLHTKTKDIRDDIVNHASQQKTIEKQKKERPGANLMNKIIKATLCYKGTLIGCCKLND